jgi:hypothetical protein
MLKVFGLVLKVLPHEFNLIRSIWVFRDDLLNATRLSHSEDVRGLRHIEGHHSVRHLMYVLLRSLG